MLLKKLLSYLLLGVLAMTTGEVMAGSSPGWWYDPWSLVVTFPLYLTHLVLILSVATLWQKTAWYQLYLFGVMFALYEAWITKVIWSGYIGEDAPLVGTLAGVGVAEFGMLVLFSHPVMSCLVPLFVYQIISGRMLPEHLVTWSIIVRYRWLFFMAAVCTAPMMLFGHGFGFVPTLLTFGGSLALLLILSQVSVMPLSTLAVSSKTSLVLFLVLLVVYIITTLYFMPERLPLALSGYLVVIGMYGVALGLLYRSQPVLGDEVIITPPVTRRDLLIVAGALVVVLVMGTLLPVLATYFVLVWYWALVMLGCGLFIWVVRYCFQTTRGA